ncbi:DUF2278 family protein [Larkinella rosea]|uniref:DUF2278 family protein n=1 Tax=Larkinella rosea TaxID=2025312 RepID=A0A3P1C275_9BACT|nr:DUF2278 family protein [Larkinella rosea]RRB06904.1 DUF2278 family protein [Larkinella rosea]
MTPETLSRPLPLGELLEQLRLEGFAVTPDVYDRCFRVADACFPSGFVTSGDEIRQARQLQELKELLGPVVARSDSEQEKFGVFFEQLVARSSLSINHQRIDRQPTVPEKPDHLLTWFAGSLFAFIVLIFSLYYYNHQKKKKETEKVIPPASPGSVTTAINPNCVLKVRVKSIEGNTVTFSNQSPGVQLGYTYDWSFNDGTRLTQTNANEVVHRFVELNAATLATISVTNAGCNQTIQITNIYRDNRPALPAFPLINAPPYLQSTYTLNWGLLLLILLTGTGIIALLAYRFLFPKRILESSEKPPYFLTFPDQDKTIKVSESMNVWARQLNQRDEGQRRVMDISRTIRATARLGGYPSIFYQQIKLRPRYLVLIDNRSTFHQQARLYAYLGNVLMDSEVELETLFFNADPRTCWSEKYPKGIAITDLYRQYRNAYLVVLSEGIRLIDYDKGTVTAWVSNLLCDWEKRAILTPVYPENWTYIEAILARFFIVLPATPDGQLLLREFFQADEPPTFTELRRRFQVDNDEAGNRGFFNKSADQLSVADIDRFLDQPFANENPTEQEKTILKQWAHATAVYPTPTWEMTLAIGKAIEQHYQTDSLVTTTNLLKITTLPWLRQNRIPSQLRQELLNGFAGFPSDLKAAIHRDVLELLESVQTAPGSLAEEERELHTYEVMLTDENRRREGLWKLAPFQQAGLITDKRVVREVVAQSRRTRVAYLLGMTFIAVFIFSWIYRILPLQTNDPLPDAGLIQSLYSKTDSLKTDSATIYNNLAVSITSQRLQDTVYVNEIQKNSKLIGHPFPISEPYGTASFAPSSEKEMYTLKLAFLTASLRHRLTFEALYNLHALRYSYGRYQDSIPGRNFVAVVQAVSPMIEVPRIVAPTSWFSAPGFIPKDSALIAYLNLLNQNLSVDSTIRQIGRLDSYGANMRKYGNLPQPDPGAIAKARQAARFDHIHLFLPDAPISSNTTRLRFPGLYLPKSKLDSLARIEAARIKLYFSAYDRAAVIPESVPANSVSNAPGRATTTIKPVTSGRTTSKSPARKKNRTPVQRPTPTKTDSYPAPAKSASENTPATATPDKQPTLNVTQTDTAANRPIQQPTQYSIQQLTRSIPGEYGVLIGVVKQTRMVNNTLFLLVTANNEDYQVRIGNENTTAYAPSADAPVIAMATNEEVRKIPAYQKFYSQKPGFYKLEKNSRSGALDYLRTGGSYTDFKVSEGLSLPALTKFMMVFRQLNFFDWEIYKLIKAFVFKEIGYTNFNTNRETATADLQSLIKSQTRIYVWGSRWQPVSNESNFKLKTGFNEIRYVHMNQGYFSPNDNVNAPWQDGGLMLESSDLRAIAIRFSSQSRTVDSNGDPTKPSAK